MFYLRVLLITLCCLFFNNYFNNNIYAQKIVKKREQSSYTLDSIFKTRLKPVVITLDKNLLYNKYTLEDTYKYGKKDRKFQWEKIKSKLAFIDSIQRSKPQWAILQNYKNKNGLAPLVNVYNKDAYNQISDTFGIERTQSIPLYLLNDTIKPFRYEHDGALVKIKNIEKDSSSSFYNAQTLNFAGNWYVPKKYVRLINDTTTFTKIIFVDVTNQNIATVEKESDKWLIRSMNPSTTGVHNPPHMKETPLGLFGIQEQKTKMFYLKDGTSEIAGFAPYASRFSDGGYIHGVPLVYPNTTLAEYSWSLGTIPRSHMCVRNATSHAKFVYDWASPYKSLLFVIE